MPTPSVGAARVRRCDECSAEYAAARTGPVSRFCSRSCKLRARSNAEKAAREMERRRECRWCLHQFVGSRIGQLYCSKPCATAARTHKLQHRAVDRCPLPVCDECGGIFSSPPRSARQGRCPACRHAVKLARRRAHDAAKARMRRDADRAAAERVTAETLAERDGWICHLCREPVNPTLRFPHPASKTVDHVVPVSKGGRTTLANCALAHLGCNASKAARPMGEQLRIA